MTMWCTIWPTMESPSLRALNACSRPRTREMTPNAHLPRTRLGAHPTQVQAASYLKRALGECGQVRRQHVFLLHVGDCIVNHLPRRRGEHG